MAWKVSKQLRNIKMFEVAGFLRQYSENRGSCSSYLYLAQKKRRQRNKLTKNEMKMRPSSKPNVTQKSFQKTTQAKTPQLRRKSISTRASMVIQKAVPSYSRPSLSAPLTNDEIPTPTVSTNARIEKGTGNASSPKYVHLRSFAFSKQRNGHSVTHSLFLCKNEPSMQVVHCVGRFWQVSHGATQASHYLLGVGTETFGQSWQQRDCDSK